MNYEKEIYVFDTLGLEAQVAELYSMVTSNKFSWFCVERTLMEDQGIQYKKELFNEYPLMQHVFIQDDEDNCQNKHIAETLLRLFEEKSRFKFSNIRRVQANLIHKQDKWRPSPPHRDSVGKHYVLICYLNDSDGHTVLFDDQLNEIQRIQPKQGRFVLFDGSIIHSACPPTMSEHRIVFNYNLEL